MLRSQQIRNSFRNSASRYYREFPDFTDLFYREGRLTNCLANTEKFSTYQPRSLSLVLDRQLI